MRQDLNFKTHDEYWAWAKTHIYPTVGVDIDQVDVYETKAAQEGSLELDDYLKIRVKDKVEGQSVVIGEEIKRFLKELALETPENMKLSPIEYVLRQKYRIDGAVLHVRIERPKQDAFLKDRSQFGPHAFIESRHGEKTDLAKRMEIATHTALSISLKWV